MEGFNHSVMISLLQNYEPHRTSSTNAGPMHIELNVNGMPTWNQQRCPNSSTIDVNIGKGAHRENRKNNASRNGTLI